MDCNAMDHYEQQLFSVFKKFDASDVGTLDRTSLMELCNTLQLEERGVQLVDGLCDEGDRVTFTQFRDGLLAVLAPPQTQASRPPRKYGRRSKPLSTSSALAHNSHCDATPSDDLKRRKINVSSDLNNSQGVLRSLDENDDLNELLAQDRIINCDKAIEICSKLHMENVEVDMIRYIFQNGDITVREFFRRLNGKLTTSIASISTDKSVQEIENTIAGRSANTEMDWNDALTMLESYGIEGAGSFLEDIGITVGPVNVPHLISSIERELLSLPPATNNDSQKLMMQVSVALHKHQLVILNQLVEQLCSENAKIKSDLGDANKRAQTLAQEVDENHARMENSLLKKMQQMEARHKDTLKAMLNDWSVEKEKLTCSLAQAEESVNRLSAEESRLRSEKLCLQKNLEESKKDAKAAEEQASELEAIRLQLTKELKSLNVEKNQKQTSCAEEMEQLKCMVQELQIENKCLRDRNDEISCELEALREKRVASAQDMTDEAKMSVELRRVPMSWCCEAAAGAEHDCQSTDFISCQSEDSSDMESPYKVRPHQNIIQLLNMLKTKFEELESGEAQGCGSCGTLKGICSMIQRELASSTNSHFTDSKTQVTQTEQDDNETTTIDELKRKHEGEKAALTAACTTLENSLEQMRLEYDKCEEYWQAKLEEEREVYTEEQRQSDERFTELFNKIVEYESIASDKTRGLPTIEEKYSLETQFTDLEEEFEQYKSEKNKEIDQLVEEISQLKNKLSEAENIKTDKDSDRYSDDERDKLRRLPGDAAIDVWSQGTHDTLSRVEGSRDFVNPNFYPVNSVKVEERVASPLQKNAGEGRVSGEGAERPSGAMIHCHELEGHLRRASQQPCSLTESASSSCAECRALYAALQQTQLYLRHMRQRGVYESSMLRQKLCAAEACIARLQARLADADLLVKELYVENCQLARTACTACPAHPAR